MELFQGHSYADAADNTSFNVYSDVAIYSVMFFDCGVISSIKTLGGDTVRQEMQAIGYDGRAIHRDYKV